MAKYRFVVIDVNELVRKLAAGSITEKDLKNALFYCAGERDRMFESVEAAAKDYKGLELNLSLEQVKRIHDIIVKAITFAEADGRASWETSRSGFSSYEALSRFLKKHHYKEVYPPRLDGLYNVYEAGPKIGSVNPRLRGIYTDFTGTF